MRSALPFAALLAALVAGCELAPLPRPPISVAGGGGVEVAIEDGARLVIRGAGGRVLLDGLAPGKAEPFAARPRSGFAVRDQAITHEMQFGSFKPTVTANGPWVPNAALDVAGGVVSILAEDGRVLARLATSLGPAGQVSLDLLPGDGPERRLAWAHACDARDRFVGFGAQTDAFDHRGETLFTWVQEEGVGKIDTDTWDDIWFLTGRRHNSQISIPEYLSSRGFVLAIDTPRQVDFDLCKTWDDVALFEVDLPARVTLFDGPSPAEALGRATAELGRPRVPPRVAFAPWIDAVFGSENVRRVAEKLREEQIPVSVVWTEDWKGGFWSDDNYTLEEDWTVDAGLYPDFPQLAGDLHALGYDLHVYFNPFVYVDGDAWAETSAAGFLVERPDGTPYTFTGAKFTDTGLLDVDDPEARAWAVQKMRDAMALGADGWMHDFAEWLPTDAVTHAGSGADRHQAYPVGWQRIAREAIDGAPDGGERLFFVRSGYYGTPALADVVWAGDQRTTFDADDGLPTIVPLGLGMGIVGISTYGHDIAGYQSATNAGSTKELFFRWTELGAWSPVMRTHHGAQPDLEWSWEKDEETTAHFRRYAELHMDLFPLWWGLAKTANETGLPIWRSLAVAAPEEDEAWTVMDEVLVGEHVLVAPVLAEGATSREVYLPPGDFYPWAEGDVRAGPGRVTADAPLGEIPVFVRAGGVVPMLPRAVMTLVHGSADVPDLSAVGDDRVLRVFLGGSGSFTEAGGLSYALDGLDGRRDAPTELRWAGEALDACGVAPCAELGPGESRARVTGAGTLEVVVGGEVVATLRIEGGSATRSLEIVLRHG